VAIGLMIFFRACSLCQQWKYLSHPSDYGVHL